MQRALLMVLALGATLALGGCSGDSETGGEGARRVALIYKATTNPFFQAMEKGAREKAAALKIDLEVAGIESESDADKQADLVRIMVNRQVDALVVAPASSRGIVTPLLRAQEHGLPVVNIDNRINTEEAAKQGLGVATFIGPDNFDGAKKVGDYACSLIKKKLGEGETGQVLILRGIDGVENAEARRRGFEAAAKEASCEIADSQSAEWDTAKAQTAASAMLSANPDVQGILCANDKMALGAIAACKGRDLIGKIVIVGYDNIDLARQAMTRGEMQGTIEQNPAMMGALGVEAAMKVLGGGTLAPETPVPVQLITPEDVK